MACWHNLLYISGCLISSPFLGLSTGAVRRSCCQGREWNWVGSWARLALPDLGSPPQDRLPNPIPKLPSPRPSLLPPCPTGAHAAQTSGATFLGPVCDSSWGWPRSGGQDPAPGDLSDGQVRPQGTKHKVKSNFSLKPNWV